MQAFQGVVRFGPENKVSNQGRRFSQIAVSVPGEQQLCRVFGPENHPPLMALQPGQQVAIARDSRGSWHLLEQPQADLQQGQGQPLGFQPSAPATAPQAPQTYQPVQQQAPQAPAAPADPILQLASQWAAAYHHLIALGVDPSAAPAAASTCLIQTGRR